MSILRGLFSAGNAKETGQNDFKDLSELGERIPSQVEDALNPSPAMQYQTQQNQFYQQPQQPFNFNKPTTNLGFDGGPTMFGQEGPTAGIASFSPRLRKLNAIDQIGGSLINGNFGSAASSLFNSSPLGTAANIGNSLLSSTPLATGGSTMISAGAGAGSGAGLAGAGLGAGGTAGALGGATALGGAGAAGAAGATGSAAAGGAGASSLIGEIISLFL